MDFTTRHQREQVSRFHYDTVSSLNISEADTQGQSHSCSSDSTPIEIRNATDESPMMDLDIDDTDYFIADQSASMTETRVAVPDDFDGCFRGEFDPNVKELPKTPIFRVWKEGEATKPPAKPPRPSPAQKQTSKTIEMARRQLKDCAVKKFWQGNKPPYNKRVKHEFFVIKITRKFVRALDIAIRGLPAKPSGVLRVLSDNPTAERQMDAFNSFVHENRSCFEDFTKPEHLPKSDRQCTRQGKAQYSSHNKQFINYYLNLSPYLRIAYYMFCQVVFEGGREGLCEAWKMRCCIDSKEHTSECQELWKELKIYSQGKMLEELNIEPYIPRE